MPIISIFLTEQKISTYPFMIDTRIQQEEPLLYFFSDRIIEISGTYVIIPIISIFLTDCGLEQLIALWFIVFSRVLA